MYLTDNVLCPLVLRDWISLAGNCKTVTELPASVRRFTVTRNGRGQGGGMHVQQIIW